MPDTLRTEDRRGRYPCEPAVLKGSELRLPARQIPWKGVRMRAYVVRVGIDQTFGGWDSPVDPETNEFVYVPIPESREMRTEFATPYGVVLPALDTFGETHPAALLNSVQSCRILSLQTCTSILISNTSRTATMACGAARALLISAAAMSSSSTAGLRPVAALPAPARLCARRPFPRSEVVRLESVAEARWSENAHTRCVGTRGAMSSFAPNAALVADCAGAFRSVGFEIEPIG